MAVAHNERCRQCKKNIENLLSALYGEVKVNYDLDLPASLSGYWETGSYNALERIHVSLQRYRGFTDFVKAKKLPRVDFFIPQKALIVEFDESQHFTRPRGIALTHYPKGHKFGFPLDRWRALCVQLDKSDNDPVFRDEQRAWYDTLRDFAPIVRGEGKTLRVCARDQAWCELSINKKIGLEEFQRAILSSSTGN